MALEDGGFGPSLLGRASKWGWSCECDTTFPPGPPHWLVGWDPFPYSREPCVPMLCVWLLHERGGCYGNKHVLSSIKRPPPLSLLSLCPRPTPRPTYPGAYAQQAVAELPRHRGWCRGRVPLILCAPWGEHSPLAPSGANTWSTRLSIPGPGWGRVLSRIT